MENSVCLMLAASFHTAIDIDSIINQDDLNGDGIIRDNHITILYDESGTYKKTDVLNDVRESLSSEFEVFMEFMKDSYKFSINDVFYLDSFNNDDSSYLVLRLKEDNSLFSKLKSIHEYIVNKYGIYQSFTEFKPHMTIAELLPGRADKYLYNSILNKVLSNSKVGFEDLVFSEPGTTGMGKYDRWNITTFHAIERFFRETKID